MACLDDLHLSEQESKDLNTTNKKIQTWINYQRKKNINNSTESQK